MNKFYFHSLPSKNHLLKNVPHLVLPLSIPFFAIAMIKVFNWVPKGWVQLAKFIIERIISLCVLSHFLFSLSSFVTLSFPASKPLFFSLALLPSRPLAHSKKNPRLPLLTVFAQCICKISPPCSLPHSVCVCVHKCVCVGVRVRSCTDVYLELHPISGWPVASELLMQI